MIVWALAFLMVLVFMTFWVVLSPSVQPTSWLLGSIVGGLRVTSQLLTNRAVARTGAIPKWVSLLFFVGMFGGAGAFLWSLATEGWVAAVPIAFLGYFPSTFVPSVLRRIPSLEPSN